jgi:Zn-dependent M28 family amino/carboxypeptidase
MSKLKGLVAALVVAAAAGAVAVAYGTTSAASGAASSGEHFPPSAEVRAMLAQVSPGQLSTYDHALVAFKNRNTLSAQNDPNRGVGAARDYIFAQFKRIAATSDGRMTVRLQSFVQPKVAGELPRAVRITNVIATLRGSQPASVHRVYVVSGHYDSRCTDNFDTKCLAPGGDDDASGVSGALEMARVMATHHFDATIVFMAVAGEEQGLFGSEHFAEQARKHHLDVAGMLDNDIIGTPNGSDAHSIRLFSEGIPSDVTPDELALIQEIGGENDAPARELARFIKSEAENRATGMHIDLIYRVDRFLRGGDQLSFLANGYRSAVRFTEQRENFDHQHQNVRVVHGVQFGDLPRFVSFPYLARATRVNVNTLAALANAPAEPAEVKISATKLTNSTTLTWKANTEPDLAGYEVVWRTTSSPLWQHSLAVGNRTRVTLPLSKDDFIFGVRAVDTKGNRSPAAYPAPVF